MTGDDDRTTVELDVVYQEKATVSLPVREVPESPAEALRILWNHDPEFLADAFEPERRMENLYVMEVRERREVYSHDG